MRSGFATGIQVISNSSEDGDTDQTEPSSVLITFLRHDGIYYHHPCLHLHCTAGDCDLSNLCQKKCAEDAG